MWGFAIDIEETAHRFLRSDRLEFYLTSDPVCAFLGDGFLFQFVTEFDFEVGAIKVAFTVEFRDKELTFLLFHLVFDKCR